MKLSEASRTSRRVSTINVDLFFIMKPFAMSTFSPVICYLLVA